MPHDTATLMTLIQISLGISQREMGDLVGVTKRTIQRWQDGGTSMLDEDQATALAERLRPGHPALADEVMALGRRFGTTSARPVSPEELAAILGAAATAGGTSPEGARPLVLAAFQEAAAQGVDVWTVVAALRSGG
jgi:transcriptional regulator with XRE-family HTH domain